MEKQVLSIEQMQELQALGIDISGASMCWWKGNRNIHDILAIYNSSEDTASFIIPTFTLQDILEMLPYIFVNECACVPVIYKNCCVFVYELDHESIIHKEYAETTLEAAFKMLKWCKQNKYI